ncbi:MAG TPA: TIGR02530 family flagellar biosynthesis protein [Candidatus Hydrogenedentes bacterium]|nr:TIGR02530 family flagellar biosynthesis protein [Candidatus Hydrogenedentota bacterium]HOL78033.1 TIGR02530 family flagellar biosynthesis protein [Candidatus Hydrogenedentota bacterium]HPO84608.1 TIGR02530 family flagellar biosynthesis protein [Candidatus Hydrogenedentota bacterium]
MTIQRVELGGVSRTAPMSAAPSPRADTPNTAFSATLTQAIQRARQLKFSAHALERMRQRGIVLSPDELAQLETAVDTAASKGARETLVLMKREAFIVSVPNRTVITAARCNETEDTVFTNIDSAIVLSQVNTTEANETMEQDRPPTGEVLMPWNDRNGI